MADGDWRTSDADTPESDEPIADGRIDLVGTFAWVDSHGCERAVDIFAEAAPGTRLWVYASGTASADRVPVAVVSQDGRFSWTPGQPAAAGVDTMAAYNDVIQVCRQVQRSG